MKISDDSLRKLYEQEAEEMRKKMQEIERNPLSQYSTSELKTELRRRKRN